MTHIIPYLTSTIKDDIAAWSGPKFLWVIDQSENARCKNCGDVGYVYVTFCEAGPFRSPPGTRKPIKWYDGGPDAGKGWYIVGETRAYLCPHCKIAAQEAT